MSITDNLHFFQQQLEGTACRLVTVTKTHPVEKLQEAYDAGARLFGENKVQEMAAKYPELPADIEWHLIGHLQTNKVKYIAPFVNTIQQRRADCSNNSSLIYEHVRIYCESY